MQRVATYTSRHPSDQTPDPTQSRRPPIAPFPPLDEAPVSACLGAPHGSIPRPLVLFEAGARGEIRFRWQHMPPYNAWLDATACGSFPPCPGLRYRGAGFHPQASRQVRLRSPCPCPSALGRGRRLDCGSGLAPPARLVVGGPTSCARGGVLNALAPLPIGSGSPGLRP